MRCKMRCTQVSFKKDGAELLFNPVTTGSKENNTFFKYTPSGEFKIRTINTELAATFIPGEDYYVDFSHAPA